MPGASTLLEKASDGPNQQANNLGIFNVLEKTGTSDPWSFATAWVHLTHARKGTALATTNSVWRRSDSRPCQRRNFASEPKWHAGAGKL